MAGVIKSKGNEIFTQGVRQVNTDTGSRFVTEALQRATNRITDATYAEAVKTERETGRQAAITTPIKRVDGKIVFEDITEDMSRVARNAALPIIQQNYAREFKIDADKALVELRTQVNSAQEFNERSVQVLDGLLSAVPEEFQGVSRNVIQGAAALSQNQHYSAMMLDEAREQERIRLENLQLEYQDQADMIGALVVSGDIETADAMYDAYITDLDETGTEDGLTDANIRALKDLAVENYMGTLIANTARDLLAAGGVREAEELAIALETRKAFPDQRGVQMQDEPDRGIRIEIEGTSDTQAYPRGLSQEQIDMIESPAARKRMAAQVRRLIGNHSTQITQAAKMVRAQSLAFDLAEGNHSGTSATDQKALDMFFLSEGIASDPQSWMSNETQARLNQSPFLRQVLTNGNILPQGLANLMEQVANGQITPDAQQMTNLLSLYMDATHGLSEEGETHRSKNMSDSTVFFFDTLHNYGLSYGLDRLNEGANLLSMDPSRNDALRSQVQVSFGDISTPADKLITNHMFEENKDMMPGTIKRLMPIALRAYGSLPKDKADEVVENAYKAIYTKTNVMMSKGGAQVERAEFAPEAFYGKKSPQYTVFVDLVENSIRKQTANKSPRLGKDHFLVATEKSTNRKVVWMVRRKDGSLVQNKDGMPLTISSAKINLMPGMQSAFDQARQEKIARARRVRQSAIDLANDQGVYP